MLDKIPVYHLTDSNPPLFKVAFTKMLADLGYKKFKFIPVPKFLFMFLVQVAYLLLPHLRSYIQSAKWYLPYITQNVEFDQLDAIEAFGKGKSVDEGFLNEVNKYARDVVFTDAHHFD